MKQRFKYRIYPTDPQKISLAQLFGCVRVVFNDDISVSKKSYREVILLKRQHDVKS